MHWGAATLATAAASVSVALASGAASAPSRPNIILVLADDLDTDFKQDRLALMPNLRDRVVRRGAAFTNFAAAQPICGPSRTSLLAGRYPHNVGYKANNDPASELAWLLQEGNTVGTWLTAAGYYTAYFGKYVNGMEGNVPTGWSHWGGFSSGDSTYNFYNATLFNVSAGPGGKYGPVHTVNMLGVHQADFLGNVTVQHMAQAVGAGQPFFMHVNPVMPHWGTCVGPCPGGGSDCYGPNDPHWEWTLTSAAGDCPEQEGGGAKGCALPISPCPSVATAGLFANLTNPHVPSWNASASGAVPPWVAANGPGLTSFEAARQDMGFRNRTASLVDLDRMLGVILDGLTSLGQEVADSTYVIFTSDNGYHLGEHKLVFGKQQPYDHDVRVPFYVTGPGIQANVTRLHPATHVDLAATLVELAGATPTGPSLDGLSFASAALTSNPLPPGQWRNFSFSEYFLGKDTWIGVRYPALSGSGSGDDDDVSGGFKVHWWCTNTTEVFDLAADQWELVNIAGTSSGSALAATYLPQLAQLAHCSGAQQCSQPAHLAAQDGPDVTEPGAAGSIYALPALACYNPLARSVGHGVTIYDP